MELVVPPPKKSTALNRSPPPPQLVLTCDLNSFFSLIHSATHMCITILFTFIAIPTAMLPSFTYYNFGGIFFLHSQTLLFPCVQHFSSFTCKMLFQCMLHLVFFFSFFIFLFFLFFFFWGGGWRGLFYSYSKPFASVLFTDKYCSGSRFYLSS